MIPLARVALLVRPKRRYKEWADALSDADDVAPFDLDQARLSPAVYLVAVREDVTAAELIDQYAADIFEVELEAWHTDEAAWPPNRSPHVFRDWFDVMVGDLVVDLDPDVPIDVEDEAGDPDAAGGGALLDALSGASDVQLSCGWCSKEMLPDAAAVTVMLKGVRASQATATQIALAVDDRVVPAVVPADGSDAAREGTTAIVVLCSDECADVFRAAWTREHGKLTS